MKTVQCRFCGDELLVVPDVKAMDTAIAEHAYARSKPKGHLGVRPVDIANDLTRQVIEALTVDPAFVEELASDRGG